MENGLRIDTDKRQCSRPAGLDRGPLFRLLISLVMAGAFISHAWIVRADDVRRNAPALVRIGRGLVAQKRYGAAAREFEKAIALEKTYVPAYEWLGQTYARQGMIDEALNVFRRAISASPNCGSLHFNLGVLLGNRGSYDEAIEEYKKAIELGTEHAGIHHNLGILYSKQGKSVEAIAEYRKAVQSTKDSETDYPHNAQLRYDLALELGKLGDVASAVKSAKAARECIGRPQDSRDLPAILLLHYDLGALLSKLGDPAAALAEFEEAAALIEADAHLGDRSTVGPNKHKIWESVAGLSFQLRRYDKAEKAFRKLIEEAPDGPNKANYHAGLSAVYMDEFRFDAMEDELKQALRFDPSNAQVRCMMGRLYSLRNDLENAKRNLRLSLAVDPNNADAHFLLGAVFQEQGKSAKAIREFRKAIKIDPNVHLYHYRLANELIRQNRREEGMKHLREYEALLQRKTEEKMKWLKGIQVHSPNGGYGGASGEGERRSGGNVRLARSVRRGIASPPTGRHGLPDRDIQTKHDGVSPQFVDVTRAAGLRFKHHHGAKGPVTILETKGAGVAFCDYNKDGFLDVYATNGCDPDVAERAFARANHMSLRPEHRAEGAEAKSEVASASAAAQAGRSAGRPADAKYRNALYRNLGDGTYVDVTLIAGVGDAGYGFGCVFGDYDNDGDDDLYVSNYGKNTLYRNDGDGTFTDATDIAGVGNARFGSSCAFADYDLDGDLDLYVTNFVLFGPGKVKYCRDQGVTTGCGPMHYEAQPDALYRNNGDGTFTDVSKEAGIAEYRGTGLGVVFADYDNDGDQDFYVANDTMRNFLFRNDGNGEFTEVAVLTGVAFDQNGDVDSGMGVDFGDYNRDGCLDLFVTNFHSLPNTLYLNEGNGNFTPATSRARLAEPSIKYLSFGTRFFDYDNDGYLDIFIANGHVYDNVELFDETATYRQKNQLFRNERDGTFEEVTDVSGPGLLVERVSRGAAFGDYDNDGDTDIVVSNSNDILTLLRNDGGNANNFLTVELVGVRSNRNGIGSRITLSCKGRTTVEQFPADSEDAKADSVSRETQIAEVRSGASFLSNSDFRVCFGLGDHRAAESVEIKWPSGIVDRVEDVPANSFLRVVEGMVKGKVRK